MERTPQADRCVSRGCAEGDGSAGTSRGYAPMGVETPTGWAQTTTRPHRVLKPRRAGKRHERQHLDAARRQSCTGSGSRLWRTKPVHQRTQRQHHSEPGVRSRASGFTFFGFYRTKSSVSFRCTRSIRARTLSRGDRPSCTTRYTSVEIGSTKPCCSLRSWTGLALLMPSAT